MAEKPEDPPRRVTFQVSTSQRPDFKHPLAAYLFDARGELIERADVRDGKVELTLPKGELGQLRVFIAPAHEKIDANKPTPALMERLGAYEPVLQAGGPLADRIEVPSSIIDNWPFCFCWVRGKVVRHGDNRAVCNARVHICEVDRIPWLIRKLPDAKVLRLRDDFFHIIRNPPIPPPGPDPGPLAPGSRRHPAPLKRSTFRFAEDPSALVGFSPQPGPPGESVALHPQPLPPRERSLLSPE